MTKAHKYTSPFHRFIGEGEILLLNSVESFLFAGFLESVIQVTAAAAGQSQPETSTQS
jgi:hypothetical protein